MKNKKFIIITMLIFVFMLAILCGLHFYKKSLINSGYNDTKNSLNQYAKEVTMIELIATPEKFDGELVRIIGVGNLEFEGNCIALSKDDLKYNTGNSIWIELGKKAIPYKEAKLYNGEYVIVEGIFDKDYCGHMDRHKGSINNISRYELQDTHLIINSMITQAIDKTYSYSVTDYNGQVLISEKGLIREPKRDYVSTDIVGISIQAGTGISTRQTTYYDLENSKISKTFSYTLAAQGKYVIYVDYTNGKHNVIVQDIFDKSTYCKEYELENCSPVVGDIVVNGQLTDRGKITVTYLTGENYKETDIEISFP